MNTARITVHPAYRIGAFLEPIGSMVNGSMYNPKHPAADSQGFRGDFFGALREARPGVLERAAPGARGKRPLSRDGT